MIRFAAPWLLVLIPAMVVGGVLFFRAQKTRHIVRAVVLILVILALAGTEVAVRTPQRNTVFLVDRSASVARTTSPAELHAAIHSLTWDGAKQSLGVIEFAERSAFTSMLGPDVGELSTTPMEADGTHLSRAVSLALATLPSDDANQLILVSDGAITDGLRDALGAAQLAGVPISVLPVGEAVPEDNVVASFLAPADVSLGQTFALEAEIESSDAGPATLALYRNDVLVQTEERALSQGANFVSFTDVLIDAGSYVYRLVVKGRDDRIPENDSLSRLVRTATRPQILVVDRGSSAVPQLLDAIGADFAFSDEIPSLELLSEYRQLILVGVALDSLTAREVTDIERFTRNLGGGVLVILGEGDVRGFAPSPIESILPISFSVPEREIVPSLAIVYLLDRSSSMRALSGAIPKIRMMRNAAAASITLLPSDTLIGVIAFDDIHQWIIPISPVGRGNAIYGALQTIRAQGGTELYEPINDALNALIETEARSKHLILISDGRTSNEGRDFPGLMDRIREQGDISLSAIALGKSPMFELLDPLVEAGGGALFHVTNFLMLPQITMQVTQRLSRSRFMIGPTTITGSALQGADLDSVPDLSGYVLTFPRASARTDLWAGNDPLFSAWRVGLGSVSVFNADLEGIWSDAWLEWPQVGALFAELLEATQPMTLTSAGIYPSIAFDGAETRVTVDVREGTGDLANFLEMKALLLPDEVAFEIPQVGPGLYSAIIETPEEGGYALQLTEATGGRTATVPMAVPYAIEYRSSGIDDETIDHIARMTGGTVLELGDPIPEIDVRARARFVPFARELLLAALALFLFDLLLRKLPRRRRLKEAGSGSRRRN